MSIKSKVAVLCGIGFAVIAVERLTENCAKDSQANDPQPLPSSAGVHLHIEESIPRREAEVAAASAQLRATTEDSPERGGSEAIADDADNAAFVPMQTEDELEEQQVLLEHGYRWLEQDPARALRYFHSKYPKNLALLTALAADWARRDPLAAATWAAQLPPGQGRLLLPSLTATWAEVAPLEAVRFAANVPDGLGRNEAIISALAGWVRQDPHAALAWVQTLPAGSLQEKAYDQAWSTWAQQDSVAAAEWVLTLPVGTSRDMAASNVSGALAERHPQIALTVASIIESAEVRHHRMANVARRWLVSDPRAAEIELVDSEWATNLP